MRYIIYILLLVGFLYGQSEEETIPVPKSDVIEWANKLKQYETSDSLQTSLISDLELQVKKLEENSALDSLIISTRLHQIDLLKETNELYKEKIKVEQQNLFNSHKRKFKSTLLQICPNYQQGTKIEVIKPKSKGLIGFFKRSPGFNKEKTESRFNSFYFNSIVGVKTKVHVFPEAFNDEKEKENRSKENHRINF